MAQYHFAHNMKMFQAKGVMFNLFMYVPEEHLVTKEIFYECEDEAHLIKVYFGTSFVLLITCIVNIAYSKSCQKWRTIQAETTEISGGT